jgi:hypothetical protein
LASLRNPVDGSAGGAGPGDSFVILSILGASGGIQIALRRLVPQIGDDSPLARQLAIGGIAALLEQLPRFHLSSVSQSASTPPARGWPSTRRCSS